MGYAEKRGKGDGTYWRGRNKLPGEYTPSGKPRYGTVRNEDGTPARFGTKKAAERAATAQETEEAQHLREAAAAKASGRMKFAAWAQVWYDELDLDDDTIATYGSILENHLNRVFGTEWLDEITPKDVSDFRAAQLAAGYMPVTVGNHMTLLRMILADAAEDPRVTLSASPARQRRRRGRKAPPVPVDGEDEDTGDEQDGDDSGKVITDPLGALLIAERAALLSGRDDEFTAIVLGFYTGMRWGELVGLETRYWEPGVIRIWWTLAERSGRFYRKRPKFGKKHQAVIPPFLDRLLERHIGETCPRPCPCHGRTYMFSGLGRARGSRKAVTIAHVAAAAACSQSTVSAMLNGSRPVSGATHERIAAAIEATGWTPDRDASRAPHWYASGWRQWIWWPAASGWYPPRKPMPSRPVPVSAEPWPGIPLKHRGNAARAGACWVPLAAGMTPHGWRHAGKSLMAEMRIPEVMSHHQLGHQMPGIAGVYSHPTEGMRAELKQALALCWEKSLDQRLALCPRSQVRVLDMLLQERAAP